MDAKLFKFSDMLGGTSPEGGGGVAEVGLIASLLLPNHRRLRCLSPLLVVSELLASLLTFVVLEKEPVAFSGGGDGGGVASALGVISTNSASRHHFRRLVYRFQLS